MCYVNNNCLFQITNYSDKMILFTNESRDTICEIGFVTMINKFLVIGFVEVHLY